MRARSRPAPRRSYAQRLDADDSVLTSEWHRRLLSWKTVGLFTIPLAAFALGTWQVQRLKWKRALLDDINDRMHRRPIPLPLRVSPDEIDRNEYRRVLVHGTFDHAAEMLVGPRAMEGEPGFLVVTPLVREDGSRVLVNRGWIRRDLRAQSLRPDSLPTEPVTLVAFVRKAPGQNSFTPLSSPQDNDWFSIDLPRMARFSRSQEVLLDAIQPESVSSILHDSRRGIPIGSPLQVDIRNNHLQYLITWYVLGVFTTAMLVYKLRKPPTAATRVKRMRDRAGSFL
ncbi:surf-like protein [Coemansia sp. RSA 989]|nr:surf-like protein [Coemansia sp. RSA 1086]KAJ1748191.1 surf-like protein [Coemansia sp. RSA 1821]KAJ1862324.1 surf-like protein [Coemansia sp. RSA 989]KAJ1870135.1 surf-like protein [Coemansia sp. RSA 990]KAJ2670116.1 surf-like protein [Coemansia sp. RSA 1085]